MVISYILLNYERISKIKLKGDWLGYLWNQIISETKFDKIEQNRISFITFNYDRLVEYFLITSMAALYGKPLNECEEKLNKIPIVHLHGKLGELSFKKTLNKAELGEKITEHIKLNEIANNLKIITEEIDNDPEFKIAHELILAADEIYILGLGYNQTNLKRLKISEFGKPVNGSGFALTEMEIYSVQQRNISKDYRQFKLEIEIGLNCLEFLRNKVFWD
jgi:hypothetical protein